MVKAKNPITAVKITITRCCRKIQCRKFMTLSRENSQKGDEGQMLALNDGKTKRRIHSIAQNTQVRHIQIIGIESATFAGSFRLGAFVNGKARITESHPFQTLISIGFGSHCLQSVLLHPRFRYTAFRILVPLTRNNIPTMLRCVLTLL